MNKKISVLGAGSWGTALAILAARNGCPTLLWGHNPDHIATLARDRQNRRYLPDAAFPESLAVTSDLAEVAAFSNLILVAVPSHAFKDTLIKLKPYVSDEVKIAWATKGFNPQTGALLHEIVAEVFSTQTPAAAISGPSFAREVAAELPTAITIASSQPDFASQLADILHSGRFRAYTSSDLIGVEVGGAVKNVLAIATGIADGLGFGANTRAALITRGLTEVIRLGIKLGGKQETFMRLEFQALDFRHRRSDIIAIIDTRQGADAIPARLLAQRQQVGKLHITPCGVSRRITGSASPFNTPTVYSRPVTQDSA